MVRVPSHRASSDVASGKRPCTCLVASVRPCSFGASERTPAQLATRRKAHPISKSPTTAMRYPWRTTEAPPSLHVSPATNTSEHATQRSPTHLYGGLFTQVLSNIITVT